MNGRNPEALRKKYFTLFGILATVSLWLAACGGDSGSTSGFAVPEASPASEPTAVQAEATKTAIATPAIEPVLPQRPEATTIPRAATLTPIATPTP